MLGSFIEENSVSTPPDLEELGLVHISMGSLDGSKQSDTRQQQTRTSTHSASRLVNAVPYSLLTHMLTQSASR